MPFKECPDCQEKYGVRTLKCTCGHVFIKGKAEKPKKPVKLTFDSTDDIEDDEENLPQERTTKNITLNLDEDEKLTIDKLAKNCKPFNRFIDDNGRLILDGSVFIVGRGMDDFTHKRKPILPCDAVYAKVIANKKDGTLSVWVLDSRGEPDRVYSNAVA